MNKRDVLEDRQRKWMEDRKRTMNSSQSPMPNPLQTESQNTTNKHTNSQKSPTTNILPYSHEKNIPSSQLSEEKLITKLTEKISTQIREEIKKEMKTSLHNTSLRDVVADKMENYLQAELHTHTCKICDELMLSPKNTPIILFPCGHTFCKCCVDRSRHQSIYCPYCR